jgi:hypothetical protein
MRIFLQHYIKALPATSGAPLPENDAIRREIARSAKIVCDEELLDASSD